MLIDKNQISCSILWKSNKVMRGKARSNKCKSNKARSITAAETLALTNGTDSAFIQLVQKVSLIEAPSTAIAFTDNKYRYDKPHKISFPSTYY